MDLVGPVGQTEDPGGQVHSGQRQVVADPGAAPDLDGPIDHPVEGGRDEDLDGRDCRAGIGVAVSHLLGGVDGHEPSRLDVHVGLGDEALDELLVLQQPSVDLAGEGPLDHEVERPPHLAHRVHAVVDPSGTQTVLGRLVALADQSEGVLDRDSNVFVLDLAVVGR